MRQIERVSTIVENGLCIGCGLCQSLAGPERIQIVMTPEGLERPVQSKFVADKTMHDIVAVCPGTQIVGLPDSLIEPETTIDPIWGPYLHTKPSAVLLNNGIVRGYATDPEVRFKGSSGGVLTALAIFLVESGAVDFVFQVAASQQFPMHSERQLSFDRAQILNGAGSRYGPAAPLVDFVQLLERQQPFAFIGKPCDIGAVRNLARLDPRVDEYIRYYLTFFCGGASELGKSQDVLKDFGVQEEELSLFRYRGYGNPGLTRIETQDGRVFEKTYNQIWEDEAGWRLQSRCKICPDAIGEAADLAAFDLWPGATPVEEDEGFNGIMVRTRKGAELLEAAVAHKALTVDQTIAPRDIDYFQPHQVRKKKALWARLEGLRQAGQVIPEVSGLRIESLSQTNDPAENLNEIQGTLQRAQAGKMSEPPAQMK